VAGDEEIPERECVACKNLKSGVVGVVWCLVGVYKIIIIINNNFFTSVVHVMYQLPTMLSSCC